jgi:hypothetical protein
MACWRMSVSGHPQMRDCPYFRPTSTHTHTTPTTCKVEALFLVQLLCGAQRRRQALRLRRRNGRRALRATQAACARRQRQQGSGGARPRGMEHSRRDACALRVWRVAHAGPACAPGREACTPCGCATTHCMAPPAPHLWCARSPGCWPPAAASAPHTGRACRAPPAQPLRARGARTAGRGC